MVNVSIAGVASVSGGSVSVAVVAGLAGAAFDAGVATTITCVMIIVKNIL